MKYFIDKKTLIPSHSSWRIAGKQEGLKRRDPAEKEPICGHEQDPISCLYGCFNECRAHRELPDRRIARCGVVCGVFRVIHRGFGELHKALDRESGVFVAIRVVRLVPTQADLPTESELLMKCACSPFIVPYKEVIRNGNELWVCISDMPDRVVCHGVLSPWIPFDPA